MTARQRAMISWFGIRGIGSVYYLLFAIRHGVTGALAQQLITFTLVTVAASIVVHGVSVTPLMRRYVSAGPQRSEVTPALAKGADGAVPLQTSAANA